MIFSVRGRAADRGIAVWPHTECTGRAGYASNGSGIVGPTVTELKDGAVRIAAPCLGPWSLRPRAFPPPDIRPKQKRDHFARCCPQDCRRRDLYPMIRKYLRPRQKRARMRAAKPSETPDHASCIVCGGGRGDTRLLSYAVVRSSIFRLIATDHPGWSEGRTICRAEFDTYLPAHIASLLSDETGDLEAEVLDSVINWAPISQQPAEDDALSFRQRMADRVASFDGSWTFILSFLALLVVWIVLNANPFLFRPFDLYPVILLNLAQSCIAAIQAPVIMMSQGRQDEKDRQQAKNADQVGLKTELEIRQLHEKIDHQTATQWQWLVDMQDARIGQPNAAAERLGT